MTTTVSTSTNRRNQVLHLGLHHLNPPSLDGKLKRQRKYWEEHKVLQRDKGMQTQVYVIPKSYHHHVIRTLTCLLALNPSSWSGKSWLSSIFYENSQYCTWPFTQKRYPCSHRPSPVAHKWCHRLWSLVHKRLLLEPLCHWRRNAVPWVKREKEKFLKLLDDKPCVLPYPYCCGSVELEIPHPRILEATSPTNLSTIHIH